jgi:DsbC/DsbD-like thiol-disulfide interchange protein
MGKTFPQRYATACLMTVWSHLGYARRPLAIFLSAFFFLTSFSSAQLYQGQKLVEATLVADTTAIVPGQTFRLGLLLRMAPGWHT